MRLPVELSRAHRLINHGPTVLVSAEHAGRRNVMAAAWVMPLDFDPPKLAVVLDKSTFTRGLIEATGRFAISVPCRAQARLVTLLGKRSGHQEDKFASLSLPVLEEPAAQSPLLGGCVAWLDCARITRRKLENVHDLFLAEVQGAWADHRVFSNGRWHFGPGQDDYRTLHHVADGHYFAIGEAVEGR
jgi:flavin reductase (DIM6/NTAB) family NADH-FMN oxidoreductase RutF